MLPSLPQEAEQITVLLQAKLDIVSELRWCMVDGVLKGNMWKTMQFKASSHAAYPEQIFRNGSLPKCMIFRKFNIE